MKSANLSASRIGQGTGLLMIASVLLFLAAGVAAYLGWSSFSGRAAIGCGPDSGCDKVLHSKWAYWFGIPVSLLAIPIYLALAVCAFRLRASRQCRRGRLIASSGALVLIGVAVWFTLVQVILVKAFCPFCMTAHALGFASAVLLLLERSAGTRTVRPSEERGTKVAGAKHAGAGARPSKGQEVPSTPWMQVSLPAILLLGVLIAGQALQQRKTFAVSSIPGPRQGNVKPEPHPAPVTSPTSALGAASATPTPARLLPIYGGQFQLPIDEVPIIGQLTAPRVIVSLFDYTCHHCRIMHERLVEVQRTFSNQLGIINLPMPLDPACNTLVKSTHPDHVNACEYARIGLAVWRARRSALETYNHWIFVPPRPPPVAEARRYAAELVGIMALEAALADPWVNAQIQRDIAIYDMAYRAGQGSMPQLIIGGKVAVGTLPIENVYQLLADELGLKATGLPSPATVAQ